MAQLLDKLERIKEIVCQSSDQNDRWTIWTDGLLDSIDSRPQASFRLSSVERRWELVSGFQKSVRRGNKPLVHRLVCAMASMPEFRPYMWRRIVTVAAEDIGAANPLLMCFVIAASSVFTSSTLEPHHNLNLWRYLTGLMCDSDKSRIYCQYSIIEAALRDGVGREELRRSEFGQTLLRALLSPMTSLTRERDLWLKKANWRAEGMAVGPIWHRVVGDCSPVWETREFASLVELDQLPSYAYDMHTRSGGVVISRLLKNQAVREFFAVHRLRNARKAVGYALFYEEGGLIDRELVNPELVEIEQLVIANIVGLSADGWSKTRRIVRELIAVGELDRLRVDVLSQRGYGNAHPG